MNKRRKKRGLDAGMVSIAFIVLVFVAVMSIQIYKLKEKDAILAEIEQNRQEQLENESQRREEIEEWNLYTKTIEYIKEIAYKLGIISENEIIFKEKK